jgi:hypothetical protein
MLSKGGLRLDVNLISISLSRGFRVPNKPGDAGRSLMSLRGFSAHMAVSTEPMTALCYVGTLFERPLRAHSRPALLSLVAESGPTAFVARP